MRQASIGAKEGSDYLSDASTRSQPRRIVSYIYLALRPRFYKFWVRGEGGPFPLSSPLSSLLSPLLSINGHMLYGQVHINYHNYTVIQQLIK